MVGLLESETVEQKLERLNGIRELRYMEYRDQQNAWVADKEKLDAEIVEVLVEAGEAYWALWGDERKAFETRADAVDYLVLEFDWDVYIESKIEHPDGEITSALWDDR